MFILLKLRKQFLENCVVLSFFQKGINGIIHIFYELSHCFFVVLFNFYFSFISAIVEIPSVQEILHS